MCWKEFIISFLWLVSFDCLFGFLVWYLYKFIDYKYFSKLEISTLKEENKYLKEENQKVNGASTDFWTVDDIK